MHTSHIPNPRSSKHPNELAGRAAIVADWYDICQSTVLLLYDLVKHVHEAIGSGAATEDDYFSFCGRTSDVKHLDVALMDVEKQ